MLAEFLRGCAQDAVEAGLLMSVSIVIRGRNVRCTKDMAQRSGRYESGGLASIGNLYLQAFTADLRAIADDPSTLLGDVATVAGKGWRIFGTNIGDVMTTLTLQRDTEG